MFIVCCDGPFFEKADVSVEGADEAYMVLRVRDCRQLFLRERAEKVFRFGAQHVPQPAACCHPEIGVSLSQSVGLGNLLEHKRPRVIKKERVDFGERVEFIQVLGIDG